MEKRSEFQQEVVKALLESKAIDLAAIGATFGKFGERAALDGEALTLHIDRKFLINCGWPGVDLDLVPGKLGRLQAE